MACGTNEQLPLSISLSLSVFIEVYRSHWQDGTLFGVAVNAIVNNNNYKLGSRLSSSKVHFMEIGRFAFLRPPLADLLHAG